MTLKPSSYQAIIHIPHAPPCMVCLSLCSTYVRSDTDIDHIAFIVLVVMEQLFYSLSHRNTQPRKDTRNILHFTLDVDMTHLAPLVAFPTKQTAAVQTAVVQTAAMQTAAAQTAEDPEHTPSNNRSPQQHDSTMMETKSECSDKYLLKCEESIKKSDECCCENIKAEPMSDIPSMINSKPEIKHEPQDNYRHISQPQKNRIIVPRPQHFQPFRTLVLPDNVTPITEHAPSNLPREHCQDTLPSPLPTPEVTIVENSVLFALYLYEQRKWTSLKEYLNNNKFHRSFHPKLQDIWYMFLYEEWMESRRLTSLSPPQKYRIRSRNPLPLSISSVKFKSNNMYDAKTRNLLNTFYEVNPYPDRGDNEVVDIVRQTGLTAYQVKNYFKNKRSRSAK